MMDPINELLPRRHQHLDIVSGRQDDADPEDTNLLLGGSGGPATHEPLSIQAGRDGWFNTHREGAWALSKLYSEERTHHMMMRECYLVWSGILRLSVYSKTSSPNLAFTKWTHSLLADLSFLGCSFESCIMRPGMNVVELSDSVPAARNGPERP